MVKVKNLLRIFKTREEYDEVKCELHEKSVSNVHENGENDIEYKYENYFIGTYNVTSTTSFTKIFDSMFTISQVTKMYIDDVEIEPTKTYTFNTTGEHTVKCEFCELTSCNRMFLHCNNLTSIDLSGLDTSNVTNMCWMFGSCFGLTSIDLTPLDTSNVTDMSKMFNDCQGLTSIDLSGLDTSNVTDMSYMFDYCPKLTSIDLSGLDTSNVTNMCWMFSRCRNLTSLDLSNLDTSNVTDMSNMFGDSSGLTSLDVSSFNTSAVTGMSKMFSNCRSLTSLDLSNFDTSNVTNMSGMFSNCYDLTSLDLSGLDTSNVTNMSYMFNYCSNLTSLDLSSFNTSACTDMSKMFYYCQSLTSLNLTPLDTSNVTNMSYMFNECRSLTSLNLTPLDTSKVTNMSYMFGSLRGLTSLDLSNFDTSNVTDMSNMFLYSYRLTSLKIMGDISKVTSYSGMFSGITTSGELTYNCDYEDAWNNILVTNQSSSRFPSTWTTKCVQVYEFVDLGLPSGTQWATFNVGATKPEEYGLYFAWGETEGYVAYSGEDSNSGTTYITDANGNETTKTFSFSDYKLCNGSSTTLTKYNNSTSYGTVDYVYELESVDDAAFVTDNSLRMPTSGECQELITNTTSAWTSVNGVNGMTFTSKVDTSKSIFIPAAGHVGDVSIIGLGYDCEIWSSSLNLGRPSNASMMCLYSTNANIVGIDRCAGLSVRPVKNSVSN